jgi:glycosyltransferase involved in cell wall biosynthesis
MKTDVISIVVPVLNEEAAIPIFLVAVEKILRDLDIRHEIVFVDDGSTDSTADVIREHARVNSSLRLIRLSRNFGKEAALTAGMDIARGDAVIPIDVDLQDPPELIADFVRLWREGYDVVYGQRVKRSVDSGAKRTSAGLFLRTFQ